METLLLVLIGAGILYGIFQGAMERSDERLGAWRNAAESCGLQVVEASSRLKAQAGPVKVQIEDGNNEDSPQSRIVVEAPAPPDFQYVTIRPEPLFQLNPEIEIGDLRFDMMFLIEGPPSLVLALLDAEVRRLLLAASHEGRTEISYGQLQAVVHDEKIPEVLPLLLEARKRFIPPVDIPRRLAGNAVQDPEPRVRLKNLLLLINEFPDHAATAEALRKACSDPSPQVRLRAARELDAEGRATLLEIAKDLQDDAASAEAVSLLDRELPFEPAKSILAQALSLRRLRTACACLEVLGRTGAAAVDPLAEALASKDVETATAAARALGATGSPAAEPALIQALEQKEAVVRRAAAEALGHAGSTAAVLPLKEAVERSRLDLDLRRAVRQAIAGIQSRVQGASPGQLSLTGAEAGQLSLAQAEAGELSLAEDPAGQLSLPDKERPA